ALFNQQDQAAKDYLEKSVPYINSVRYSNVAADSLVYLGRAALKLEVDPRVVLEVFYDPGMKATPPLREAFLAAADLALEKEDYAVAESTTQQGLIHFPEDADLLYRWARALAGSGNDQMGPTLNRALESNPHHVPSMLMLVDHSIDAEQNDQAIEVLDRILEVNPNQPEAWAYKAIMAHLDGNSELETTCRERALKHYQKNPEIDHLIGKKLSQKYRFKEGATYQEAALALEQAFRPAQLQLAQDLLRLGDEAQGWALADDIHNKDGYNITAYNLVQLKEVIGGFKSME
ncbi:MAG: tetratricopeptide repeat protein, partial [Verrucomicrobiota bacterium]